MVDTPRTRAELVALFADNSNHDISAQDLRDYVASMAQPPSRNLLINGDFHFWQRSGGAGANFTDDTYFADRWIMLSQTAFITAQRYSGLAGYNSYDSALITQPQATAQRFGLLQIVEGIESYPYRNQKLQLSFNANLNQNSALVRYAIVEWTGTMDAVTSDIVNSWTNTTFTPGNFFNVTSLVVTTGSTTVTSTTTSCSLTATIGNTTNNIMVFIWFDSPVILSDQIAISDIKLGQAFGSVYNRTPAEELIDCQRFYEKSNNLDVAPGAVSSNFGLYNQNISPIEGSNVWRAMDTFRVYKRITPAVVLYDYAGNVDKVSELSGNATGITNNNAASPTNIGHRAFSVSYDPAGNIGGLVFHWTADAEL